MDNNSNTQPATAESVARVTAAPGQGKTAVFRLRRDYVEGGPDDPLMTDHSARVQPVAVQHGTTSRHILATVRSYDIGDDTSIGYTLQLRGDGSVRAVRRSRWSGSMTGTAQVTPAGRLDVSRIGPDEETDAEAILTAAMRDLVESIESESSIWRTTRRGWRVS